MGAILVSDTEPTAGQQTDAVADQGHDASRGADLAGLATALRAAVVIVVAVGLVGWVVWRSMSSTSFPVMVRGHHTVELEAPATVRTVLRASGVHLQAGALRTASRRGLAPGR